MEEKHNLSSKIILIISVFGISAGILIPFFGIIDNLYWGEIIDSWIDFIVFVIFALLCLTALVLTRNISKEDKYRRYSFILSIIGLCINGFWIVIGLPGLLY